MFESALHKPSLFAQVSNASAVVVRKHLVSKDGISNLRCLKQVHFEQACLQSRMLRLVVLQGIEEERGRLLHKILTQKNIGYTLNVNKWAVFISHKAGRELGSLFRVYAHNVT